MNFDVILQEQGQYATLAGVLGGFAFAATMQLVAIEKKSKIITATVIVFAIATFLFLIALLMYVSIFGAVAEISISLPEQSELYGTLGSIAIFALIDTYAAILILLGGIGLAGWIRSKATGITTTILAVVFLCLGSIALGSVYKVIYNALLLLM